jgi:glycosyltransferase involved in cell wall biosynthesis
MKICINTEAFSANVTSCTPSRGMVRELIRFRPQDTFFLAASNRGRSSVYYRSFLDSLEGSNWQLCECAPSRVRMVAAMLGYCYTGIRVAADVYLNVDMDILGYRHRPVIVTVADLSSVAYAREFSSLKWHGRWLRRSAFRRTLKHADAIVCMSRATEKDVLTYAGPPRGTTEVIPCGIDEAWRSHPVEQVRDDIQRQLGQRPFLVWWGHMSKRKNLHRLIRAYAKLQHEGDGAKPNLVLMGRFSDECADLPSLAAQLDVAEKVIFLPPQDLPQLIAIVHESSGVVFPSLLEGFGLPAVEAMCLGKPVLVSNTGSLPEVTGGLGIEVDPLDIDSILHGLHRLTCEPFQAELAQDWTKRFSYPTAAQAYSATIDRIGSTARR